MDIRKVAGELMEPGQATPGLSLIVVNEEGKQERKGHKKDNTNLVLEMATNALKRNSEYFKIVHADMLTEFQKLQDKIDEYTDEGKRNSKVLKLMEKLNVMKTDIEVFENLYNFTDSAKKELETCTQLEFDFAKSA